MKRFHRLEDSTLRSDDRARQSQRVRHIVFSPSEHPPHLLSYRRLVRYTNHGSFARTLLSLRPSQFTTVLNFFRQGLNNCVNNLWPAIYLCFTAADWTLIGLHEKDFSSDLFTEAFTIPRNPASLSYQIVSHPEITIPTVAAIMMTFGSLEALMGSLSYGRNHRFQTNSSMITELDDASGSQYPTLRWLNPYNTLKYALIKSITHMSSQLSQPTKLDLDDESVGLQGSSNVEAIAERIISLGTDGSYLQILYSRAISSRLIDEMNQRLLNNQKTNASARQIRKQLIRHLLNSPQTDDLAVLESSAPESPLSIRKPTKLPPLVHLFSLFHLWRIGELVHLSARTLPYEPLFWFWTLCKAAIKSRLFLLITLAAIHTQEPNTPGSNDNPTEAPTTPPTEPPSEPPTEPPSEPPIHIPENAFLPLFCDDRGNTIEYNPAIGGTSCTFCNRWPQVFYSERFSPSNCFTAFSKTAHSEDQFFEVLQQIPKETILDNLDFSAQNWTRWSEPVFDYLVNETSNWLTYGATLDFSSKERDETSISPNKLLNTLWLANVTEADTLNLENRTLGVDSEFIFPENLPTELTELNLSRTHSEKIDPTSLGRSLARHDKLTTLFFDYNPITPNNSIAFFNELYNSSLTYLSFRGYQFRQETFDAFVLNLPQQLNTLDISEGNLSDLDLNGLASLLPFHPLETLKLSNCGLTDAQTLPLITIFNETMLMDVDFSNNRLSASSAQELGESISNSKVHSFSLSNNRYDDRAAAIFIANLDDGTALESLDLSHNQIGDMGCQLLIRKMHIITIGTLNLGWNQISATCITSLGPALLSLESRVIILSGNAIRDSGFAVMTQTASNSASGLTHIEAEECGITSNIEPQISALLNNDKRIEKLNLRGNLLHDATVIAIARTFPTNQLLSVDLSNTGSTRDVLNPIFQTLRGSQVNSLKLSNLHPANSSNNQLPFSAHLLLEGTESLEGMDETNITCQIKNTLLHAAPATSIRLLELNAIHMTQGEAVALTRTLPALQLSDSSIQTLDNPTDLQALDWTHCVPSQPSQKNTNDSKRNIQARQLPEPTFLGNVMLLQVFWHLGKKLYHSFTANGSDTSSKKRILPQQKESCLKTYEALFARAEPFFLPDNEYKRDYFRWQLEYLEDDLKFMKNPDELRKWRRDAREINTTILNLEKRASVGSGWQTSIPTFSVDTQTPMDNQLIESPTPDVQALPSPSSRPQLP